VLLPEEHLQSSSFGYMIRYTISTVQNLQEENEDPGAIYGRLKG
jgi:hypothetical protein